jgi:putative membrane protein
MNRWWGRWTMVGMMAMGSAALGQEGVPGDPYQPPREEQRGPAVQPEMMARALVAPTPQGFLQQLYHLNQLEMTLGHLTQMKAWTAQVQAYGRHLQEQHHHADEQLRRFAREQGIRLLSPEPGNDLQRRLQAHEMATKAKLALLHGPLYDQQFLASQVAAHDEALALVMAGLEVHPQLAPVVDQMLPMLKDHRERAYRLLGEVGNLPALPRARTGEQPPARRQARPPAGERR